MWVSRRRRNLRSATPVFLSGSSLDMIFSAGRYRGATAANLTVTRASTGYAEDTAGNLTSFGNNVARITDKGLLVEEARTNSALRSEEFDNASWTKSNVTVSANSLASPDGTVDADTLTATGANGTVTQGVTTAAVSWTFSVWLRRLTGTGNVDISMNGTTWATQTITSTGWTRCSVTQTGAAGTSNPGIRIVTSGDAVYAFGAQAELGAFATSYIPTTTAALARAADAVSLQSTAFSSWYTNSTAGTLFAEHVSIFINTGVVRHVGSISDGSANNRATIFIQTDGLAHGYRITNGGATSHSVNGGSTGALGASNRTAMAWQTSVTANEAVAGSLVGADDATVTAPVSPNRLNIGVNEVTTGQQANGYIRRIAYFPTRLSNTQLQIITASSHLLMENDDYLLAENLDNIGLQQ